MVDMSLPNDFKSQVREAAAVRVKRFNGIWLARLNLGKLSDTWVSWRSSQWSNAFIFIS